MTSNISIEEALERLRDGNYRFSKNLRALESMSSDTKRLKLVAEQKPFAIILGCSDSRVPAEIIFDQGLGDLFVIRIAGNVVAPSQIGSVEFAVSKFGTSLVIVLGHSQCGAVQTTVDVLNKDDTTPSKNISTIVDRIKPSVQSLMNTDLKNRPDELLEEAIRANVRVSANHLRHGSEMLEKLIDEKKLAIVGAEYNLETGEVDFFDKI